MYYNVSFQYSETVFCSNIAIAENENDVAAHYSKYAWYAIKPATENDVAAARERGKPIVKCEHVEPQQATEPQQSPSKRSKASHSKPQALRGKAAVYAKYDIQYKAGKIYCEYLRAWLRPVLVNGNEKLGKGVWTFSTLAGNKLYRFSFEGVEYTELGTCGCSCPGCYAQTGCFRFSSVIRSLGIKTMLARFNRDFLRRAILAQIEADHVETLRIHAAGDFFSAGYIAMWHDIIESTPAVKYWSYTKYAPAEHAFDDLPNMNMVPSLIPGAGMNYGRCNYVLQQVQRLQAQGEKVHVCRCGIDAGQHCAGCKGCSENKYVLFIEHSTAYRAEEDPDFIPLRQLIEMQGRR